MTISGVQHPALNRPHQLGPSRINPPTQPLEFVDPHHRITSIVRSHPGGEQLIHRHLRVGQCRRR